MSTHRNRVQMTVSGTPGTGTITLNAASSSYQSFATAYGGNATVDILITEGTAWEVARDCTYTNSSTTVTRGTLEASSTGSAVSFTSAAVVSVIATADRGRTWDAASLNTQVAGTDANTTMAVNTLYTVDMSAWATADRTYTLPATAAVGDRIGVMVTAGNASYELLLTAGTGDTLNGVAGGTEWSRLFITNEVVVMRCIVANATWVVEYDGRIPCEIAVRNDGTTTQSFAAITFTKFAAALDAEDYDRGDCWDNSVGTFTARRAGFYTFSGAAQWNNVADATSFILLFRKGGSDYAYVARGYTSVTGILGMSGTFALQLAVGDTIEMYGYNAHATISYNSVAGAPRVGMSCIEVLP